MALQYTNWQSKQIFGMFFENISLNFKRIFVFLVRTYIISVRIYEILMNSYESSIIYGVPGQHLMGAPSARFEIQPLI